MYLQGMYIRRCWHSIIIAYLLTVKYIRREYRAIASLRHIVYFEFRAKVYRGKGIILSIKFKYWSEHGGRWRWKRAFPQFIYVSVHIFGRNCTCVRSREKILLPHIFLYYVYLLTMGEDGGFQSGFDTGC